VAGLTNADRHKIGASFYFSPLCGAGGVASHDDDAQQSQPGQKRVETSAAFHHVILPCVGDCADPLSLCRKRYAMFPLQMRKVNAH
jgi:hypothetical protein